MSEMIPQGWEVVKLNTLVEHFQNGFAFSSKGYVDRGVPIVTIANISVDGGYTFNELKENKWSFDSTENLERYIVKNDSLIISMTDVTPTMNLLGRGAIVKRKGMMYLNQRVGLLNILPICNKHYLAYYFNGSNWRNYCRRSAGLAAQANLGTKDILEGLIKMPPLAEQQKIASILTSIDDNIQQEQKELEQTKNLKKSLMQDLLTGKVRVKMD